MIRLFVVVFLVGSWFFTSLKASPVDHHHSRLANQMIKQVRAQYGMRCEGIGGSINDDRIRKWTLEFDNSGRHSIEEAMELYVRVKNSCCQIVKKDQEVIPFLADDFNLDEGVKVGISYSEANERGEVCWVFLGRGDIVVTTDAGKWEPLEVIARRPYTEVEKQVFGESSNPPS